MSKLNWPCFDGAPITHHATLPSYTVMTDKGRLVVHQPMDLPYTDAAWARRLERLAKAERKAA